jgi:hypothetical protein
MNYRTRIAILLFFLIIAGCSTPYQQIGTNVAGGYYSERIDANRFEVSFVANGFTTPQKASDFALLRSAEITLEYNFSYFTIDGQGDLSRTSTIHMGSTSTTSGTVSPYGTYTGVTNTTYNDVPVHKPGTRLTITCYEALPNDKHIGRVYEAKIVAQELRAKYKIK